MRPVRDHSAGAYAVDVVCYTCGKRMKLSEAIIDADGVPFRAYYHPLCLPDADELDVSHVTCERWDCARCPREPLHANLCVGCDRKTDRPGRCCSRCSK